MNSRSWFAFLFWGASLASSQAAQNTALSLIPSLPSEAGWTLVEGPEVFGPETLFEYLNGAAPQYLSYRFKELAHVRYAYRGDDLASLTLDVFEMADPLGAYGIYSSGRPRQADFTEWGTEGYLVATVAAAWKNCFYVHGSADDERPVLTEKLKELIAGVTSTIPGNHVKPPLLAVLPEEKLVSRSDRYVGKDLLGHAFLPGGVLAEYRLDATDCLLFLSELASSKEALHAWNLLRAYEKERGELLEDESQLGERAFWAKDPGLGLGLVGKTGSFVVGLWGVTVPDTGRDLLQRLVDNLEKKR